MGHSKTTPVRYSDPHSIFGYNKMVQKVPEEAVVVPEEAVVVPEEAVVVFVVVVCPTGGSDRSLSWSSVSVSWWCLDEVLMVS